MYDFTVTAASKSELYRDLAAALDSLTADEPDAIANMANVSALIWQYLPDLNWAGFYRNVGGELVLGPFQGKAACIRIPFGKGVCGAAAAIDLRIRRRCGEDRRAQNGCGQLDTHVQTPSRHRAAPLLWLTKDYRFGCAAAMTSDA